MRYVADPLSEDPGVSPPPRDAAKAGNPAAAAPKGKAAGKKKHNVAADVEEEEGGRPAIFKVLRELIGKSYACVERTSKHGWFAKVCKSV